MSKKIKKQLQMYDWLSDLFPKSKKRFQQQAKRIEKAHSARVAQTKANQRAAQEKE